MSSPPTTPTIELLSRTEINHKAEQLKDELDNCSALHTRIFSEFSYGNQLSYDSLACFKEQLVMAIQSTLKTHNEWCHMRSNLESDLQLRNKMDRI